MSDSIFTKPDRPFLLLSENTDSVVSYFWCETEEELQEVAKELIADGDKVIESIEIGSCRDVDVAKSDSGDFVEKVLDAYETAIKQEFDSIVLAIDTDNEETYYINDTENGFQCDNFDYYFDDLNSLAGELFEKILGNVTEIRIE